MTPEQIAQICHETNRAYCELLGDTSQAPWNDASDWQKQSTLNGVVSHQIALQNREPLPPSHSHDLWLAEKRAAGWKYGPVKDAEKKEHPCFVSYHELPAEQRVKDYLFSAIVKAFFDAE